MFRRLAVQARRGAADNAPSLPIVFEIPLAYRPLTARPQRERPT